MSTSETNSNTPDLTNPQSSQGNSETEGNTQSENQATSNTLGSSSQESQTDNTNNSINSPIIPNPIANPQTLPSVIVGVEDKPNVKEPSLPIIGFNLSSFVLVIITGFILFLTIYLSVKDFEASALITIPKEANISDSTYIRKIELIRMIQEEKKSYREFTVQMSQMVLLNLLLPVLTAILGYIFASNKNNNT